MVKGFCVNTKQKNYHKKTKNKIATKPRNTGTQSKTTTIKKTQNQALFCIYLVYIQIVFFSKKPRNLSKKFFNFFLQIKSRRKHGFFTYTKTNLSLFYNFLFTIFKKTQHQKKLQTKIHTKNIDF